MRLFSFARKHVRFVIGLLNVALLITGIQFASARARQIVPRQPTAAAHDETVAPVIPPSQSPGRTTQASPSDDESRTAAAPAWKHDPAALPIAGKGMWIWLFKQAEGGDPVRIVHGSLAGMEGKVLRRDKNCRFFIEVRFLQRAVSAEIESWMIQAL